MTDTNDWREECNYITRLADSRGKVAEMNYDTATFVRYCEMQRNAADKAGFFDVVEYIQHVIDDMEEVRS